MTSGEIILVAMLLAAIITPAFGLLIWAAVKDGQSA
jgi:hypothetical protein